jgi:hypothetical protein
LLVSFLSLSLLKRLFLGANGCSWVLEEVEAAGVLALEGLGVYKVVSLEKVEGLELLLEVLEVFLDWVVEEVDMVGFLVCFQEWDSAASFSWAWAQAFS